MTSTSIHKGEGQFHVQRIDVPGRMRRNGIVRVAGRRSFPAGSPTGLGDCGDVHLDHLCRTADAVDMDQAHAGQHIW